MYMPRLVVAGASLLLSSRIAHGVAQALEYVLRRCGDDLTRENVMRIATHMHDVAFPLFLPGVRVNTSPTDYHPIKQFQMMKFNGKNWDFVGGIVSF